MKANTQTQDSKSQLTTPIPSTDVSPTLVPSTLVPSTLVPSTLVPSTCLPSPCPNPPSRPRPIDTLATPFPKTLAELNALDATREIPYLKAICNRRFIATPGHHPTPEQIIPIIERIITAHMAKKPTGVFPTTDIFVDWQITRDDLTQFLQNLRGLCAPADHQSPAQTTPPAAPRSNFSAPSDLISDLSKNPPCTIPPPQTSGHSNNSNNPRPKTHAIQTHPSTAPKTPGHSNISTPKNFSIPQTLSQATACQSPAVPAPELQITNFQLPITNPLSTSITDSLSTTPHPQTTNQQSSIIDHQSPSQNTSQNTSALPSNPQSAIRNPQSTLPTAQSILPNPPSPAAPQRRTRPLLSTLTHDQKQQLVTLYQQNSALDAVRIAREKLHIHISVGALSNLHASWQIAEDQTTREDLEATHNTSVEDLTRNQLHLRLLELASRPNMDTSELRAICHSFARLESLSLSARRVELAEAREARLEQKNKSHESFSVEACSEGLDVMWGKSDTDDRDQPGADSETPSMVNTARNASLQTQHPGRHDSTLHSPTDFGP